MQSEDDDTDKRTPLAESEILSRLKQNTRDTIDPKSEASASLFVPDSLVLLKRAAPGECNWMLPDLGQHVPTVLARAIALEAKKLRDAHRLVPPAA